MTVRLKFGEKDFYFDGYLDSNMEIVKKQINEKDMDMVGLIDGYEGSGKSVVAQQIAYRVDPTLDIDRICFTPEEFRTAVMKAKRGQAIIYDEAITGAFNREAVQQINILMIKMMAQIRQRNLFILIVLPSFFDLDRYLTLWRTKFLIHVHFGKNFERGFFKFANLEKKKHIYISGQKFYKYPSQNKYWNFYGRFVNFYTVNEKHYRIKKSKSFKNMDYERISIRKTRLQRDSMIIYLSNLDYTQEDISEISDLLDEGLTHQAVSKILTKHRNLQPATTINKLKSKYGKMVEVGESKIAPETKKTNVLEENNGTSKAE